ncbi:RNA-directed DNA polymerase (Reverse transcriptase) [Trifolium medium]|uniref:RNA-directed DNA polymerase (Reverse transcriptase) n=1 Tax=Trifolium medium TaxID=97028 RepID=A0A392MLS1_9FABA|nr:RNA-directed DNA polymerase (Reverse transcriptase) [Trifolium medium]
MQQRVQQRLSQPRIQIHEKVGPIYPGRGLRQGDPLSPYLFILVTGGLTTLIKNSVARGDIHDVKICRGAPMVSHLLFADGCFLFYRSNLDETHHLMRILKTCEEASGQEINLSKSEVFFSRNLSLAAHGGSLKNYGSKTCAWNRVWKRINSWRGRAISRAGKEVMIKSVLQAISCYIMSIYLLPDATINEIERMVNSFWWGGRASNQGIKWLAWDRMTIPKALGGMDFRDLHAFNLAMIAKQAWNIMTKPHSLMAKL